MKLVALKWVARNANGWESPTLTFGRRTTSLHAPNGSGKTPIVQAVAFCLGFDVKFQNDIREMCKAAVLTIEHDGHAYELRREFGDFYVKVSSGDRAREFFNEGDLSAALFQEFRLSSPVLVGTNRQATRPYVSTVLPIFYVRQVGGYDDPYKPPASFISDQFVEMVRFVFGLGPKRSYTAQRDLLTARDELEAMQRKIVFQQKVVADMSATGDDTPLMRNQLAQRATALSEQLRSLRESVDVAGAANDALLELLHAKEERIRGLRREQANLQARMDGIESIRSEIEGEIRTLSLNEESKRLFESFFDICGRKDCGLFESSAVSYAKNLMYLKDQIKDLEANVARAGMQLEMLQARLIDEGKERDALAAKVQRREEQGPTADLVVAVQSLTRELLETEQRRVALEKLDEAKQTYIRLDEERFRIQDRIATLSSRGRSDMEFNHLRRTLQELTAKWMKTIGTPNVSGPVEIDLDFKFRFGGQTVDVFSGSTRSRLILAIHAALFEHYLQVAERPFRFLILDTPKQHELASADLARYLGDLQAICDKHEGQIVISSTEYRHTLGDPDVEWRPTYPGPEQNMYLGTPARS
ncbi:hypothetical protein BJN34_35965 (plasmid) [Cupriavidus necator]|uniref:Rad50/SbcC-type AAA domain-containing protein n=1 Tax=Cupriavidus necator TaxID=106590 RepID=A0A1U9V2V0_CUPNE|nr:hypothetical protein [Cupriavidus necator]AQV99274.1 hypothetical protein BJN34_35965 [Cupriavidus necator]